MKENKRRSIVLTIIAIATLTLIVGAATFAFFDTGRDLDNGVLNVGASTAGITYQFSASSNDNIEMNIVFNEMSESSYSTEKVKSKNASINVSLASPNDELLTICTYDIVWVWDSTGDNIYTLPGMTLPSTINNKTYNYEFSAKVDSNEEKDLSKYSKSEDGKIVTLQEGVSIESMSTTPTTTTHTIEASIYNLPVDQTELFGKSFKAHVTINNLNCSMEEAPKEMEIVKYITEKAYKGDGVNGLYLHDGKGTYTNANLEAGDNSYRYSGANPNNYVCFEEDVDEETGKCANDDLYRIIGVIDGKAKLIKYTNDGSMAWDMKASGAFSSTWEGSQIERYLNSNAAKFTHYTGKYNNSTTKYEVDQILTKEGYLHKLGTRASLIAETTWSVGGLTHLNITSQNTQGIYNLEINPETKTEYPGKIGLMYASEYMYAAEPTYWDHVAGNNATNGYNLSKGNDWMLNTYKDRWTISQLSDFSGSIIVVYSDGSFGKRYSYDGYAVYPTFSLSSDTIITVPTGADVGSIDKPYIIAGKTAS